MWRRWIFSVTVVWLPPLTRDKGSGRIFTAIYLPLINSQLLCLALFYLLTINISFGTAEIVTSSFVKTKRNGQALPSLHDSEIKTFPHRVKTPLIGCGRQVTDTLCLSAFPATPHLSDLNPNFRKIPLKTHFLGGNKSCGRLIIHAGCLSK